LETLGITSDGLGEIFEGDFANMRDRKILLMSMGGRATPSSTRNIIKYAEYTNFPPFLFFPKSL
jgi:hypothetical protein